MKENEPRTKIMWTFTSITIESICTTTRCIRSISQKTFHLFLEYARKKIWKIKQLLGTSCRLVIDVMVGILEKSELCDAEYISA